MTYTITKDAVQESVDSFHLTDLSLWGSGGNPARNLRALVLFVTKTDKNGARTLLTVTPNTADPLTVSAWDVAISQDGLVEKILFSVQLYGAGVAYVTDDVFYYTTNGKFYKATQNSTGQTPTNPTYFVEVPQANLYTNEILNDCTTMEVVTLNDLVTGRIEEDLSELWEEVTDVFLNGQYDLKFSKADYVDGILNGAYAALQNQRQYEAEEIVRGIENYLLAA